MELDQIKVLIIFDIWVNISLLNSLISFSYIFLGKKKKKMEGNLICLFSTSKNLLYIYRKIKNIFSKIWKEVARNKEQIKNKNVIGFIFPNWCR